MYIIESNNKSEEEFYQKSPNFICQNAGVCKAMGRKCRDPRCSLECRNNWAAKESAILREYLRNCRPDDTKLIRGNLTLPIEATESDHKRVRTRFMSLINAWKRVKGITFGIRCYLHLTSKGGHYDFIGYTSSPFGSRTLSEQIGDLWRRSGGTRSSLQVIEGEKYDALIKYAVKDLRRIRERKKFMYLPRRHGLSLTFGTRGFFQGTSAKELWQGLIESWFPPKPIPVDEYVSNYNKENNSSEESIEKVISPAPAPYVPPYERQRWGSARTPLDDGFRLNSWWCDDESKQSAIECMVETMKMSGIHDARQVIDRNLRIGTYGEGVNFGIILCEENSVDKMSNCSFQVQI